MKILVIEDNLIVSRAIERKLKSYFKVDLAHDGETAMSMIQGCSYDTILLDLNLPRMSGGEVCAATRARSIDTPIIILSGRDEIEDKVSLLNMGADDYITKPFSDDELRARIHVAMRHTNSGGKTGKICIDDLELDPATRKVYRAGNSIELRRKEFDLLEYLMRNNGQVLTRTMILEHIWDMNENLWANVIDVHIKHLRDKIDRPYATKLIHTVHGMGYRLEVV